jgi:hypothetical protein
VIVVPPFETVTPVACVPPIVTVAPAAKLLPLIVTDVPPLIAPDPGETRYTLGVGADDDV